MSDEESTKRSVNFGQIGLGQIAQIREAADAVKTYVRQETLGPLRGAGRWIGYGLLGALLLGGATAFVSLGLLRMIQTEFAPTFAGRWMSLLPYVIAFAFSLVVAGLAISRISKQPLNKDDN